MPDSQGLTARARADLCLLAAHLVLRELDDEALEVLRRNGVPAVLEKLASGCAAHLERPWDTSDFDLEAAEYCRLFILPGGVSPFASSWLGSDGAARLLAAESEASAATLGLGAATPDNLPADHLGVILVLIAEAWRVADSSGQPARALTASLLDPWLPRFSESLTRLAKSPLYRTLASLIEAVTEIDNEADVASRDRTSLTNQEDRSCPVD